MRKGQKKTVPTCCLSFPTFDRLKAAMKFFQTFLSIFLLAAPLMPTARAEEEHAQLFITTNVQKGNGSVYLTIYKNERGFPENPQAAVKALKLPVQNGVAQTTVQLPKGTYAISAFYDADANGALTKNIFGAPAEPYGFSNKARSRFRAPYFSEAAFTITGPQKTVFLELK